MLKEVSAVIQQEMDGVSLNTLIVVSVWACVLVCVVFLVRSLVFGKDSSIGTILIVLAGTVYLCGLIYITLGSRELGSRDDARLIPFLNLYQKNGNLNRTAFILMMLNIALFIPLGFFMTLLIHKQKYLTSLLCVTVVSFFISCAIEFTQRIAKLGYLELEDMICNTFGGILGFLVAIFVLYIARLNNEKHRTSIDF